MDKHEKLLLKILCGTSDANIKFEDLCSLLKHMGFDMRVKGGHHMFRKKSVIEKINLQRESNKA
ncbi:type II toxin-antitoxin system HicA family toxin [Candidatus Kuenenia sp.]|uniref:type II toxin-antitoxin system HicA family toxin n=1 Tax=Candidatus Kuenenia sp. TaxID=2499824 RepID=UPI003220842D